MAHISVSSGESCGPRLPPAMGALTAGSSDHPLVQIFSKPGLALQRLTTKEPDHSMIEVAIASVEGVFDWREYLDSLNKGEQKEDE